MAQEIYRDEYCVLTLDASLMLFRYQRSASPFGSIEEARASLRAMYEAVSAFEVGKHRILLDLRRGPLRTDPGFEAVVKHYQQQLVASMNRVAILINTPSGVLQMVRQRREGWPLGLVFSDEAEALDYLAEPR